MRCMWAGHSLQPRRPSSWNCRHANHTSQSAFECSLDRAGTGQGSGRNHVRRAIWGECGRKGQLKKTKQKGKPLELGSINGEGDTCGVQAETETHTKLREVERAVEAAVQSLSYGAHVPRIRVARAAAHGLNLPETNLFEGEYALPGGGDVRNVRKRRPPRRAMQHLQR